MSQEGTSTLLFFFFFFSSRRRHTRLTCDWSSDVCSSDLIFCHWLCPCSSKSKISPFWIGSGRTTSGLGVRGQLHGGSFPQLARSEERRVGKECSFWRWADT